MGSGRNKKRLYLSLSLNSDTDMTGPAKYHCGLLLTPKKPVVTVSGTSVQYHVLTCMVDGQFQWVYKHERSKARTILTSAVMLLAKVPENRIKDMETVLKNVPLVQDDDDWECFNWTWEALARLNQERIITFPPGTTAQSLRETGCAFADTLKEDPTRPLPTCNMNGKPMSSEIGRLPASEIKRNDPKDVLGCELKLL